MIDTMRMRLALLTVYARRKRKHEEENTPLNMDTQALLLELADALAEPTEHGDG